MASPISSGSVSVEHPVQEPALEQATSAYPFVLPMKAALYFPSAKGFGEWRILISTHADRDLRQLRNRNKKHFEIVVKKIKYVPL